MMIDKELKISLLLSLGIHSLLFSPLVDIVKPPAQTEKKPLEVTYVRIEREKKKDTKPLPIKEPERLTIEKDLPTEIKKPEPISEKKKPKGSPQEEKTIKQKEKPTAKEVPQRGLLKKSMIKPGSYGDAFDLGALPLYNKHSDTLNYLRAVRDRINGYVHNRYNPSMGEGEVLLHFVLKKDGSVETVSIISDNLGNNYRLRRLCINSIYDSAPFRHLPDELELPSVAFNIPISFQRK